jgi:3-hydroxybutyryl-CoA dehydrogenase
MNIKQVGICGSGIMGSGVAEVAAKAGFEVVLRSRTHQAAESSVARLEKSLGRQVERGRLDKDEAATIVARVHPTSSLSELGGCQLVIESIVEDLHAKKALFEDLDQACDDQAILATNTSTLPVIEIAMATSRPERVVGIHFFNPAPVMALVEVVATLVTSAETQEAALEFARSCGKEPVTVKDRAGFIVNALLFPYLNNAVRMLESGTASKEDIDAAMKGGCGFPMGPLALLDLVGLDTSVSILEALHHGFAEPHYAPVPLLRRMVSAGMLGKKSGQGFYSY